MISEHEKACTDKISKLEESLKKKKQVLFLSDLSVYLSVCDLYKHVLNTYLLFSNSGQQNFQRFEENSWFISGR